MKLLFVIHSLRGGGYERVLANLTNSLAQTGRYEITIMKCVDEQKYEIDRDIEVLCFDKKYEIIHNTRHWSFFELFRIQYIELKNYISKNKPDIIISFNNVCLYPLLYLSKIKHIPLIFSEHQSMDSTHLSKKQKWEIYHLCKYAEAIVFLTKQDISFVGNKLQNKVQIYNQVSFTPLTKEDFLNNFNKRKNIILAIGVLNDWYRKGFDVLIKAFSIVSRQAETNNWILEIAGYSPNEEDEKYLKSLCREYNVEDKVRFLGFCSNIAQKLQTSKIFVLSSRQEGFPMVALESMANGCAIITTDISGCREMMKDEFDSIFVPIEDKKALSNGIKDLILDEEKRRRLGLNAIESVKRFSPDSIIAQWEELFKQVKNKVI